MSLSVSQFCSILKEDIVYQSIPSRFEMKQMNIRSPQTIGRLVHLIVLKGKKNDVSN